MKTFLEFLKEKNFTPILVEKKMHKDGRAVNKDGKPKRPVNNE